MPSSLDALRALTSNQANPDSNVQFRQLQQRRLDEMTRNRELAATSGGLMATGATASDVSALKRDMAADPNLGDDAQARAAELEQQSQSFADYNRPEATAIRNTQKQDALQKLLAPIQMRGEYAVKAAQASSDGRADVAASNNAARASLDHDRQESINKRSADTSARTARTGALRDRLKGLQGGKVHAAGAASGLSAMFGRGKSQDVVDREEIASLLQQLADGDGSGTDSDPNLGPTAPNPGTAAPAAPTAEPGAPTAPAGWRYVRKPGGGWTAVKN